MSEELLYQVVGAMALPRAAARFALALAEGYTAEGGNELQVLTPYA